MNINMFRRRRRYGRRRRYRRKFSRYRRYRSGSSAFRRYNGARSEKKFFDDTQATFSMTTTGAVASADLFLITQGSTANQRIGRKILITDLYFRGHLFLPGQSTSTHDTGRIIILLDKQANGANPVQADILVGTNWKDFRNLDTSHRFKVLATRTYNFAPTGITTNFDANTRLVTFNSYNMFIALNNLNIPIMYDASTGALGDLVSNNIVIYTHSEKGLVDMSWKKRVRYRDS